jgi:hypothetical protein
MKRTLLIIIATAAICFASFSCKEKDVTPELVLENTVWIDNTTQSPTIYKIEFGDHGLTASFSADFLGGGSYVLGENCTVQVSGGNNITLKKLGETDTRN